MDVLDFPKETKPREIFIYACQRIAEPLMPLGFKYRKSKNDIIRSDTRFQYEISFQPSLKFGSTYFTAHVQVESAELAEWRESHLGPDEVKSGLVVGTTLARLAQRAQEWPTYDISTLVERERVIAEITKQIHEAALPFFERFQNLTDLVKGVGERGFFPHHGKLKHWERKPENEFCQCFSGT